MRRSNQQKKARKARPEPALPGTGEVEAKALSELERKLGHKHPYEACREACQGHLSLGDVALCRAYQTRSLSDEEKGVEWTRWPKPFKDALKRVAPNLYSYPGLIAALVLAVGSAWAVEPPPASLLPEMSNQFGGDLRTEIQRQWEADWQGLPEEVRPTTRKAARCLLLEYARAVVEKRWRTAGIGRAARAEPAGRAAEWVKTSQAASEAKKALRRLAGEWGCDDPGGPGFSQKDAAQVQRAIAYWVATKHPIQKNRPSWRESAVAALESGGVRAGVYVGAGAGVVPFPLPAESEALLEAYGLALSFVALGMAAPELLPAEGAVLWPAFQRALGAGVAP